MFYLKIMVVEDSELLHRMYDMFLSRYCQHGWDIIHAYHGAEALSKLHAHPDIGLILLDINMPVMSGLEFLQRFREEKAFADIPVVLLSSEGKKEDTVRGLKAGARAYITKPFQADDLHKVIGMVFPQVMGMDVGSGPKSKSRASGAT